MARPTASELYASLKSGNVPQTPTVNVAKRPTAQELYAQIKPTVAFKPDTTLMPANLNGGILGATAARKQIDAQMAQVAANKPQPIIRQSTLADKTAKLLPNNYANYSENFNSKGEKAMGGYTPLGERLLSIPISLGNTISAPATTLRAAIPMATDRFGSVSKSDGYYSLMNMISDLSGKNVDKAIQSVPGIGGGLDIAANIVGDTLTDPTSIIGAQGIGNARQLFKIGKAGALEDALNSATSVKRAAELASASKLFNGSKAVLATNVVKSTTPILENGKRFDNVVERNLGEAAVQPSTALPNTLLPKADNIGVKVENPSTVAQSVSQDNATGFGKNTVGAGESQFPYKEKVSEFYNNTIHNTNILDDVAKQNLNATDFTNPVVSENQSLLEAKQRLQVDFEGEVADLGQANRGLVGSADVDTAMGILGDYGDKLSKSENAVEEMANKEEFATWAKNVGQKAHEGGQVLQGFAKYTRTSEGKVVEEINKLENANRKLTDKVDELGNTAKTPLGKKIDEETKVAKTAVDGVKERAAKQVDSEIKPEELLAKKVDNTLKVENAKKSNAIQDMVNELFKSAKESPLPEQLKATPKDPVEYLKQAIQNKAQYGDVWEKAKIILKEKYAGDTEISSILEDYFNKGIIPPYSNATLNSSVNASMKSLAQVLTDIAKSTSGDKKKSLEQLTQYLVDRTGATGEDATLLAKKIQSRFDELVSLKSKTILTNLLKPSSGGTVKKTMLDKVQELGNLGAFDDASIADLIKEKYGLGTLNSDDVARIYELMQKSATETDDYMKRVYAAKASQVVGNKLPSTLRDKVLALRRIPMLLSPKTLFSHNALGNVTYSTLEDTKDVPGAIIDRLVSIKTGVRTTITPFHIETIKAKLGGAKKGIVEIRKDIKNGVDTSPTAHEYNNKKVFKNSIGNALDTILNKGLQVGDRPVYQAALQSRMTELKILGRDITDVNVQAEAKLLALERVFQNDSALSKKAMALRESLGVFGDITMPFAQTPSNIFDKLLDYSPYGLYRSVKLWGKVGESAWSQKRFVDTLSRTLTGGGILMFGYTLASKGIITGKQNSNPKVAAADRLAGKQPYSIFIGGKSYTFAWLTPVGSLLAAAADAYNGGQSKGDVLGKALAGVGGGINAFFQQSYLVGLSDMLSGYDPSQGIINTIAGVPAQFMPAIGSSAAKVIDPYQRNIKDANPLLSAGKQVIAKIPGASTLLPAKIDSFGQPIKNFQGRSVGSNIAESFISPGYLGENQQTPADKELYRLYQSTGDSSTWASPSSKEVVSGSKTYTMTDAEYTKYQQTMGTASQNAITRLLNNSAYKRSKDYIKGATPDKLGMITKAYATAKQVATAEFLKSRGVK